MWAQYTLQLSGDVTGIRTSLFEKSSSRVPIIGSKPLGIFFLALILYTKPSSVWQPQWARAEPFLSLTTLKPPTWKLGVRASLKKSFTPLAREREEFWPNHLHCFVASSIIGRRAKLTHTSQVLNLPHNTCKYLSCIPYQWPAGKVTEFASQ